jgi:hypothetical protein
MAHGEKTIAAGQVYYTCKSSRLIKSWQQVSEALFLRHAPCATPCARIAVWNYERLRLRLLTFFGEITLNAYVRG